MKSLIQVRDLVIPHLNRLAAERKPATNTTPPPEEAEENAAEEEGE